MPFAMFALLAPFVLLHPTPAFSAAAVVERRVM